MATEPQFFEAYYFLGNEALKRGNLLEAEESLLRAHEAIPESSQITILLASIYLATEEDKIAQILYANLVQARKDRFLEKKKSQLERTLLSRATAFYNAAAGYLNAGQKFKALEMATRSAEHPAFKEKADKLASGIR